MSAQVSQRAVRRRGQSGARTCLKGVEASNTEASMDNDAEAAAVA